MLEINRIHNSDCFDLMEYMQYENIKPHCILTSPPYFSEQRAGAKDPYSSRYKDFKQITNPTHYLQWLVDLFKEFEKTIDKDGVVLFTKEITFSNEKGKFFRVKYEDWGELKVYIESENVFTVDFKASYNYNDVWLINAIHGTLLTISILIENEDF